MRFLPAVILNILIFSGEVFSQSVASMANEARALVRVLRHNHIQPRQIDDAFSKDVFTTLIGSLDHEKFYFTKEEIHQLEAYQSEIDDDINGNSWKVLPLVTDLYHKALERAEKLLQQAGKTSVDVRVPAPALSDTWVEASRMEDKWKAAIRSAMIRELARKRLSEKAVTDEAFLTRHEAQVREKVVAGFHRAIRRTLSPAGGFTAHVKERFLTAVAAVFDPHTRYFSRTQMENYFASLSTEGYYLGIDFRFVDGELIISGLLPGGAAWKSGQITSGDRLEKFRWEGDEWIETTNLDEAEFAGMLGEFNHSAIDLLIRKAGGVEKIVTLRKEKISTEENIVRSFILEGRKKVAYISLPDFYSDWGGTLGGSRSANDVAREILKLKKENIHGIILDLRFNHGGSMAEAIEMAGIFIDAGPVGIVQEKGTDPVTLKDVNRGTVYDGPLVIMVNGLSASASEFVAAALQDHRRAIVVGSPSFGKAIGQEIFSLEYGKPVNDITTSRRTDGPGFATITTVRLYRVNGRSIQQKGVTPDVTFPDLYDMYEVREEKLPFSMAPDSVVKKTWLQPMGPLPLSELRANSLKRVASASGFRAIQQFSVADQESFQEWEKAKQSQLSYEQRYAVLAKALAEPVSSFRVMLHEFGKPRMQFDEYALNISEGWVTNLSHDAGLEETYNIICDYIDILERK